MTARHGLWTLLSVISLIGVVACSKGGHEAKDGSTVATTPNLGCPPGAYLLTVNNYQVCQNPDGSQTTPIYPGYGYQQQLKGYSSENFCYNNLKIESPETVKKFFKEAMGMCDINHSTGGTFSCDAALAGTLKVNLYYEGNNLAAQFFLRPQSQGYYYSLPKFSDFFWGMLGFPVFNTNYYGTFNPLTLNSYPSNGWMTRSPINDSKGFVGRSYGMPHSLANRSLIEIQVANGLPGATHLEYKIGYMGTVMMSGTFINSQTYNQYCPMSNFAGF